MRLIPYDEYMANPNKQNNGDTSDTGTTALVPLEEYMGAGLNKDWNKTNIDKNVNSYAVQDVYNNSKNVNPESDALDQVLAQKTGINVDDFRTQPELRNNIIAELRDDGNIDWDQLKVNSPTTYKWLQEQNNMNVARDDIQTLSGLEKKLSNNNLISALYQGVKSGVDQVKLAEASYREMTGDKSPENMAEIERLRNNSEWFAKNKPTDFIPSSFYTAMQMIPQMGKSLYEGGKYAATGASAVALAGWAATKKLANDGLAPLAGANIYNTANMTRVAIQAGMATGQAVSAFKMEAGLAYDEFKDIKDIVTGEQIDDSSIKFAASLVGAANAAIEVAQLEKLASTIPGFKNLYRSAINKEVKNLLKDQTTRGALKDLAKKYGEVVTFETATEVLQEASNIFGGEFAKNLANGKFNPITGEEVHERLYGTSVETAPAMAILATFGLSKGFHNDYKAAKRAQANQDIIKVIGDTANSSKLLERYPERFREFVEQVTKDGDIQSVYIPVEYFQSYFQDNAGKIAEELGVTASYNEALATNGDLEIPVAVYAEKMAKTEHHDKLATDIKFRPDDMTYRQAKAFEQEEVQRIQELKDEANEVIAADTAHKEDLNFVKNDLKSRLLNTGMSEYEADANASVYAARASTIAQNIGTTPKAWYESLGIEVTREGIRTPGASPKQPTGSSDIGSQIIEDAKLQIGKPYLLGADGVDATDCGMFTMSVFNNRGTEIGDRTADGQYRFAEVNGKLFADANQLMPGDLVFWHVPDNEATWPTTDDPNNSSGAYKGVSHVGIYDGNGKVLQAGSSGVSYIDLNYYPVVGFSRAADSNITGHTQASVSDSFATAKQMLDAGNTTDLIQQSTGWFQTPEGTWQYDIPTSDEKFNYMWTSLAIDNQDGSFTVRLPDIITNDSLYAAMPELNDIKVLIDGNAESTDSHTITVGSPPNSDTSGKQESQVYRAAQLVKSIKSELQKRDRELNKKAEEQFIYFIDENGKKKRPAKAKEKAVVMWGNTSLVQNNKPIDPALQIKQAVDSYPAGATFRFDIQPDRIPAAYKDNFDINQAVSQALPSDSKITSKTNKSGNIRFTVEKGQYKALTGEITSEPSGTPNAFNQYSVPNTEFEKQKQAVKEKYQGTDQWLKAPNGMPSNLTEDQWLTVRTNAFKRWFGNWSFDESTEIKTTDLNKVVTEANGEMFIDNINLKDTKELRNWLKQNLSGKTVSVDADGLLVGFASRKLGDSLKRRNTTNNQQQRSVYGCLESIIKNSVLYDFVKTDGQSKHDNIYGQDVYYSAFEYGGKQFYVKIKLDVEKNSMDASYKDHKVKEIKIEPITNYTDHLGHNPKVTYTYLGSISISSILEAEHIVKPEFSKAVDQNGEPLVLYHGTNAAFDEFKKEYQSYRVQYPEGFFFTDDKSMAQLYGDNIMPVFLNAKYGLNEKRTSKRNGEEVKTIDYIHDPKRSIWIVFSPNQIKSIDNRGTFSNTDNNIYNQFAGQTAKTANLKKLQLAMQMDTAGSNKNKILEQTGWHKGLDGIWRFEIPDSDAKLLIDKNGPKPLSKAEEVEYKSLIEQATQLREQLATFPSDKRDSKEYDDLYSRYITIKDSIKSFANRSEGNMEKIRDILSHPKLFEAYPSIADIRVIMIGGSEHDGAYFPLEDEIHLSAKLNDEQLLSTLLHEIQHAIQHREGFAAGGSASIQQAVAVKEVFKELATSTQNKVDEWINSNQTKIDSKEESGRLLRYSSMYQSVQRLRDYANRDKPSGVLRLIKGESEWLYHEMFRGNQEAMEIESLWHQILKSHKMHERNKFLSDLSWQIAAIIEKQIPRHYRDKFQADGRTVNNIYRAMERSYTKSLKQLHELQGLKEEAQKAKEFSEVYSNAKPFEIYKALAGEVEARNTEKRFNLNEDERLKTHPFNTIDINPEYAIVRFRGRDFKTPLVSYSATATKDKRGSVSISENKALIRMFKSSDQSTFMHETGHIFMVDMMNQAYNNAATDSMKKDWAAVQEWLRSDTPYFDGLTTDGVEYVLSNLKSRTEAENQLLIHYHEKFAGTWEAYLLEGKAPTQQLQQVFWTFRKWLCKIYRSILNIPNQEINSDIRGIMDRLLATEEEIESSEVIARARKDARKQKLDTYKEKIAAATQQATENITAQVFNAEVSKKAQAKLDALKAEFEKEIRADLEKRPIYIAINDLSQAQPSDKLNIKTLVEEYGKENVDTLPESVMSLEGRLSADDYAIISKLYDTGAELMSALLNTKPIDEEVQRLVQERIEREQAAISRNKDTMNKLGEEHTHNKTILQTIAEELARSIDPTAPQYDIERIAKLTVENMISTAKELLSNKPLKDATNTAKYLAAERRAWSKFNSLRNGKGNGKIYAKREQMLFHALAMESYRIRNEQRRIVWYLNKYAYKDVKAIGIEFRDQIYLLLDRFGLRGGNKINYNAPDLKSFIRSRELEGDIVAIPEIFMDESWRKPYKNLTILELQDLEQAVKNLDHLGRINERLLTATKKETFQESVENLNQAIASNFAIKSQSKDPNRSKLQSIKDCLDKADASLSKIEFIVRRLDGDNDLGTVWEYLFRPMLEAHEKETIMREDAGKKLEAILENYSKRKSMNRITVVQEVKADIKHFTHEHLLSVGLNVGNELNRKRVRDGWGWTDAQIDAITSHLDKEDWDTIQKIWDLVDSYYPQINQLTREVAGVKLPKREAKSFVVRFDDGSIREYRGGYYPIKYDSQLSSVSKEFEEAQTQKDFFENQYMRAATKKGHTKETAEIVKDRPLKLSLNVLTEHLTNVMHDLAFRKAIRDITKLIKDENVSRTIKGAIGVNMYEQFNPWLQAVANDRKPPGDWMDSLTRRMRESATVAAMGLKVTTAIAQPLGAFGFVHRVGAARTAVALGKFYLNATTSPRAMLQDVAFVEDKSAFMRERAGTIDRDMRSSMDKLIKDGTWDKIQEGMFYTIAFMDRVISVPMWYDEYHKTLKDTGSEDRAVRAADALIRQTQGSGATIDLAAVQRGSETKKMFTMFYTYFSSLYGLFAETVRGARKNSFAKTFASVMYLWIMPALLGEIMTGRGPGEDDDGEDIAKWAMGTMVSYPFQVIPMVRDVINGAGGYSYKMSPSTVLFEDLAKTIEKTGKLIWGTVTDDVSEDDYITLAKSAARTAGLFSKLPVRQLEITSKAFWDWYVNDSETELRDWLIGKRRPLK